MEDIDFAGEEITGVITLDKHRKEKGLKLSKSYSFLGDLGEGGFGKVKLGKSIFLGEEELAAIKVVKKTEVKEAYIKFCETEGLAYSDADFQKHFEDILKRFRREASSLRKAKHNNIVRFIDYWDNGIDAAYLVMEYAKGIDMEKDVQENGPMLAQRAIKLILPVLRALLYMYEEYGMYHRDIKPGNIQICDNDKAMLIDFGNAKIDILDPDHESLTKASGNMTGTPGYTAPEVNYDVYAEQDDVFSVACTMVFALFGSNPFEVINDFFNSFRRIQQGLKDLGLYEGTMLGHWLRKNTSFFRKDRMTLKQAVQSLELMLKDESYATRKISQSFVNIMGSDSAVMAAMLPEENSISRPIKSGQNKTRIFTGGTPTPVPMKSAEEMSFEELGEKVIEEEKRRRAEEEEAKLESVLDKALAKPRQDEASDKLRRRLVRLGIFLVFVVLGLSFMWYLRLPPFEEKERASLTATIGGAEKVSNPKKLSKKKVVERTRRKKISRKRKKRK